MKHVEEFNVDINGTSYDNMGRKYTLVILDKFDDNDKCIGHKCYYLSGDFYEALDDIEFLRALWNEPEFTKVAKATKIYKIN